MRAIDLTIGYHSWIDILNDFFILLLESEFVEDKTKRWRTI